MERSGGRLVEDEHVKDRNAFFVCGQVSPRSLDHWEVGYA